MNICVTAVNEEEEEEEGDYENEEFVKKDIDNVELTISSNFDQSNQVSLFKLL